MQTINVYAPNLINGDDGFTVLARNIYMAKKEILTMVNADEFDRIDKIGEWEFDHWETQDKLERQDYY